MPRHLAQLSFLQRHLFHLRRFSSSTSFPHLPPPYTTPSPVHSSLTQPSCLRYRSTNMPRNPRAYENPFFSLSKPISTESSKTPETSDQGQALVAQSISFELLKSPESASLPLSERLQLSFSHVTLTSAVILETLNGSPDAGRSVLDFFKWVAAKRPKLKLNDEVFSYFVDYFGRRKDFKVMHELLVDGKGVIGHKTFASLIDRLVRAGRPSEAISFFDKMEKDYGLARDRQSLNLVVTKLCERGYASKAENMVKGLSNEFFPDEYVCDTLIKGWCVDGKLEEARRLAREMYRGGFEIGTMAFNAILDCVCKLCRKKDPFRLQSEVEKVLMDMDAAGVPRDVETFNVLITNLCKLRKTEDALNLFSRMGEWGCYPDATTFLVLTRSLYQAARIGEGDEMIDRMKSAGYGNSLDRKAYYEFLKILCGTERIDQSLTVFARMKEDGHQPGVKAYDLLIRKLYAHGRVDKASVLFNEAVRNKVPVEPKVYQLDPRFKVKPTIVKKGKKKLTLPEKMALKRTKLRKLRLSFVKKPRKMMRRAF